MPSPKRQHGFTLAEMLMALIILSALLTAVGVAIHAAMVNSAENADIAAATQAARVVVNRVARELRTAAAVDPYAGSDVVKIVPPAESDFSEVRYEYNASSQSLLYKTTTGAGTQTQTLLGGDDGVKVLSFYALFEIGPNWEGVDCTKSATIYLTFEVDGQTLSVTASAAPRRNQLY